MHNADAADAPPPPVALGPLACRAARDQRASLLALLTRLAALPPEGSSTGSPRGGGGGGGGGGMSDTDKDKNVAKSSSSTNSDGLRQQLMLEHALHARHALARLLVATRWARAHGGAYAAARRTATDAHARVDAAEDTADALWTVRHAVRPVLQPPPASAAAAAALAAATAAGNAPTAPGPASISTVAASITPAAATGVSGSAAADGADTTNTAATLSTDLKLSRDIDDDDDNNDDNNNKRHRHVHQQPYLSKRMLNVKNQSDPQNILRYPSSIPCEATAPCAAASPTSADVAARLAAATRAAIRAALPYAHGVVLLTSRRDLTQPQAMQESQAMAPTISVAIPGVWTAKLALDSLHHSSAQFRVHAIQIHVRPNPNAVGGLATGGQYQHSRSPVLPYNNIDSLADDHHALLRRMADDRLTAAAAAAPRGATFMQRAILMLCALRDLLSYEVCAPMTMACLRSQATMLAQGPWAPLLTIEDPFTPTPPATASSKTKKKSLEPEALSKSQSNASPSSRSGGAAAHPTISGAGSAGAATAATGEMIPSAANASHASAANETSAVAQPEMSRPLTDSFVVRYWLQSRHAASIRITQGRRPRHPSKYFPYTQPLSFHPAESQCCHLQSSHVFSDVLENAPCESHNSPTSLQNTSLINPHRKTSLSNPHLERRECSNPDIASIFQDEGAHLSRASNPSGKNDTSTVASRRLSALDIGLIHVVHDPPLPGFDVKDLLPKPANWSAAGFDIMALDLEAVLIASARARSTAILVAVADSFLRQPPHLRPPESCIVLGSAQSLGAGRASPPTVPFKLTPDPATQSAPAIISARSPPSSSSTTTSSSPGCSSSPLPVRSLPHPVAHESSVSLSVRVLSDGVSSVQILVSLRTGGLRARLHGAASLAAAPRRYIELGLWNGDRHFRTAMDEEAAVIGLVLAVRNRVRLEAVARSLCALDVGVSDTLPPGAASVAATVSAERAASQLVPPFAPLERRAPRRFLTLSPPPIEIVAKAKDGFIPRSSRLHSRGYPNKRPRLTYATTNDALVYIQESSISGAQGLWAGYGEKCENADDSRKKALLSCRRTSKGNRIVGHLPVQSKCGDSDHFGFWRADDAEATDRYSGTAASAAAWAVTQDIVERRLRRDSLLRAFVAANVASDAHAHRLRPSDDGDLHIENASRTLLKVKCEPLPVRCAELLLRGNDAWQVRLSLLPPIFDSSTDLFSHDCDGQMKTSHELKETVKTSQPEAVEVQGSAGLKRRLECATQGIACEIDRLEDVSGNLWSVGVACVGPTLTFTYPSASAASVRSFFRDLTRARTAAALARGVPPSRFYTVLRRSPVRIVVGIGPFETTLGNVDSQTTAQTSNSAGNQMGTAGRPAPLYTATVEYVYSKGNTGGFSLNFSPSKQIMEELAPLIEEALDASGGQVGSILAGLLERACPVAAAAQSAVYERVRNRVRFVTALRVRAAFQSIQLSSSNGNSENSAPGLSSSIIPSHPTYCVDMDARGGGGLVKVIDVGRATAVMMQHGLAQRPVDYGPLPMWDAIIANHSENGAAQKQRAGSTVIVRMERLEQFLTDLVMSSGVSPKPEPIPATAD